MNSIIDICVIEQSIDERGALIAQMMASGYLVAQASTAEEGLEIIRSTRPKVILCGWSLSGLDGLELCRRVKHPDSRCDAYFVLLTNSKDVQRNAVALESGADDYLIKPYHPRELLARVQVGLRIWHLQRKLREAAVTDGLTGLWTHQHFTHVLESEFVRTRRYGGHLSLIMCDLDHFKAINDSFGHPAGNAVLQQVAAVFRRAVRQIDIPARYGGEEFAVLTPEVGLNETARLADRLRVLIERDVRVEGQPDYRVTASLGVASASDARVITPEDLVELADRAMYLAKRRGRNCVCTMDEIVDDIDGHDAARDAEIRELHSQVAALSRRMRETYVHGVWALVQALEARDPRTANHSRNVTAYADAIGEDLQLTDSLRRVVRNAAMLHDIGKIGVPDSILLKQEGLAPSERRLLQRVPTVSARIIDHMRILDAEVAIIRHQHEHFDGSGYPNGLKGTAIPLGARILLVADAFDAMTTDRVYRARRSLEQAFDELHDGSGRQFDPGVVDAMFRAAKRHADAWQHRIASALRYTVPEEVAV